MQNNLSINSLLSRVHQLFESDKREVSLIAIGGAGGSGKSSFAKKVRDHIPNSSILELDHYKTPREDRYPYNLYGADPKANRCALIREHLQMLKKGNIIHRPHYCNTEGRATHTIEFEPSSIIIVDGEISTYDIFRDIFDMTIFIEGHIALQLKTRLNRDIKERGYSKQKALKTFIHSNLKEFRQYGAKSKENCDIVLSADRNYQLEITKVSANLFSSLYQ